MSRRYSHIRRRVEVAIGIDRMGGSRGAEFEPGGPVAGAPAGEPTEVNTEIMKKRVVPKKPRTKEDIFYGRG